MREKAPEKAGLWYMVGVLIVALIAFIQAHWLLRRISDLLINSHYFATLANDARFNILRGDIAQHNKEGE